MLRGVIGRITGIKGMERTQRVLHEQTAGILKKISVCSKVWVLILGPIFYFPFFPQTDGMWYGCFLDHVLASDPVGEGHHFFGSENMFWSPFEPYSNALAFSWDSMILGLHLGEKLMSKKCCERFDVLTNPWGKA